MFNRIAQLYHRLDGHTKEVVIGASSALVLRILGAGLSFALSVVLSRMLGASSVGRYFLALSIVTIAIVISRVGLDNTLLRFVSASASTGEWNAVKGLYIKSIQLTLAASSILTIIIMAFAPWIGPTLFDEPSLTLPLRLMALSIIPTALFTIVAQMLLGLKRTKEGITVLSVLAPAFCLLGAIVLVPSWRVRGAAAAYSIAAIFTLIIALWRWRGATPQITRLSGYFSTVKLLQSSVPLFWVSLSQLIVTLSAIIILGIWSTNAEVGIYGAASRMVVLLNFLVLAVTSIASPKFAVLYQKGDMHALASLAKNSTKLLILASSPIFAILFLMPERVMGLFGPEFASGATVIVILAAGQLFNIMTGTAGNVLMMCGYERLVRNTLGVSVVVCIGFSFLLIPSMGMVGAAIANAVTVAVENLIMLTLVRRKVFGQRAK